MKSIIWCFIAIFSLTISSCSTEEPSIEGVWWYLDEDVYHEVEFLNDTIFHRRSFRPVMSYYNPFDLAAFNTTQDGLLIIQGPGTSDMDTVRFEFDATGDILRLQDLETRKITDIQRVPNTNLTIGQLKSSNTPLSDGRWKEYITAFYAREFNCYAEKKLMTEEEAQITRDSLLNMELEVLGGGK